MSGTDVVDDVRTAGSPKPPQERRRRVRRRTVVLVVSVLLAALVCAALLLRERPWSPPAVTLPAVDGSAPSLDRARQLLGQAPSQGSWFSGGWAGGGTATTERIDGFGNWRGTPVDAVTLYPETTSWQSIHDSNWHVTTYTGFGGVLAYGLPILPEDGSGTFESVVRGEHDWVYEQVANDLLANGRGRSIVRIGWEANGDWFPWNTTAGDAAEYVAAYRHIVGVLRRIAPELVIDFDLACGTTLRGQQDRLDALNLLYPGDDAVDLVGCDFYDWHNTKSTDEASWQASIRPAGAVGIQDVADFARAHGKGLTYPEWGLASTQEAGAGDNPFFIQKMRSFFQENADVLVLESYFSEPSTSLANSIWDPAQMPRSAELYAQLW